MLLSLLLTLLFVGTSLAWQPNPSPSTPCLFTAKNSDGSIRASFNFSQLQQDFPILYSRDVTTDINDHTFYNFSFSICPSSHSVSPPAANCPTTANVMSWQLGDDNQMKCKNAGTYDGMSWDLLQRTVGVVGIKIYFSGGQPCTNSGKPRTTILHLRCPYWLNGIDPPALIPFPQPGVAPTPLPSIGNLYGLQPEVGLVDEDACSYTIDIDTVYACPLECGGGQPLSSSPQFSSPCNNHGRCHDNFQSPSNKYACFCERDSTGSLCSDSATVLTQGSNANYVLGVFSFVLLCLLVTLSCCIAKKFKHLKMSDGGHIFGTLDQSKQAERA